MHLLVKKLSQEVVGIRAPVMTGDVGYDIFASEDTEIAPKSPLPISVPSEVSVKIPEGYWGLIVTRSSANKMGLAVLPGVIDNGYTGPLFTLVYNHTFLTVKVKKHDRLAQLILLPIFTPPIQMVTELPETHRGEKGFGSTGK